MTRLSSFKMVLQVGDKYLGVSMLEVKRHLPHTRLSGELHLLAVAGDFERLQLVERDFYNARAGRGIVRCHVAAECALATAYRQNFLKLSRKIRILENKTECGIRLTLATSMLLYLPS